MKFVTSDHHVSISGQTGAGKTYLANEIHKAVGGNRERLSVFLNTQHEEYIYGYKVRSWREIAKRVADGGGQFGYAFNYLPSSTTGEQEHAELVEQLLARENSTLLITDEAHEIAGTNSTGTSLHRAVKRGRRWNVKNLVVSQRPSAVSNDVLTQCRYHAWVGRLSDFELGYLKSYGFPVDQLRAANRHEITVMEGGSVVENYPEGV